MKRQDIKKIQKALKVEFGGKLPREVKAWLARVARDQRGDDADDYWSHYLAYYKPEDG